MVALIVALGMLRVLTQHWRQGAMLIGGALLVAALFRAVVPDDRIGLLAVRGRPVDVLCYSVLATLMIVVAVLISKPTLT
jgi:formate-dependent nitrite reductase membrane component NrfD